MTELELRKAICDVGRRMYTKNLVAATDGNISIKIGPDRFLVTPSGVCKGDMAPNDILLTDSRGVKISGAGKVTSEFFTHLAAYEERSDITAVVHAHPPKAIGFSVAGVSLAECVLPEVVMSIGGVPTTDYATPGSKEGYNVIRDLIRQCDALMLDRHGAVTVGVTVYDAYFKLEKIEHAAETLFIARMLGEVRTLSRDEVEKLAESRKAYGASGKAYTCGGDGCPCKDPCTGKSDSQMDRFISETLRVLGHG
ncbi:MAG TPA: class II aldolase/adducin family protein [Candidatus Hydrogenedentes bacterium]|nr:class II aldolase/adducin family protein [Candidatus Hydrogenedentota bacterium]HOS02594.1 class II aldolase/adducin family protein [Candidatus Hydrogenedentota bacterium]